MRNKIKLKIIVIACFIVSIIACHFSPETQKSISPALSFDSTSLKARILQYKTWTLVNAEPVKMSAFMNQACAPVVKGWRDDNPHFDKYIRVYVNELGREAMFKEDNPKFPVGSIIVKEKLPAQNSEVPEFYTIMVKRENGYDSVNGDWQYLTMDETKSRIEEPENISSCQSCHAPYNDTSDYVSREYLHLEGRRMQREVKEK